MKVHVRTVAVDHPHKARSSSTDASMAKQSMREEHKAIRDYSERGERASSPSLKRAFSHAKSEEREHAATFAEEARESKSHERSESPAAERREHSSPKVPTSKHAKAKVEKTMHEFKEGDLHSGSKHGPKVTSRKQAIAIALSQARRKGK